MKKYITKNGHIFETLPGFMFKSDVRANEYQVVGPYASMVFFSRLNFDTALEMDLLKEFVTETYTQFWN